MQVLHISQSDIAGGAAIAAYRLHQGLLTQDCESRMLVGVARTVDRRIIALPRRRWLENQLFRLTWPLSLSQLHCISSFDIPRHPCFQEAAILNLHNLHDGYFNYLALPALTQAKPTVFTLHDMWSFTGHCGYSYDCDRWQRGCGACPDLQVPPALSRDTTWLEWHLKQWAYQRSKMTIVTPSHWLADQARRSLLQSFPVQTIPYGLDTTAYQPLDPVQCRALLGISPGQRVLMFAAASLGDRRKGADLLLQALQQLPASLKTDLLLLVLGEQGEALAEQAGLPTLHLGYISHDRIKAICYSAADLFVFPTRADNLPLVVLESMACGTPIVSFQVGGVPEMVRPGITGYLAPPENATALGQGIVQLLEDERLRLQLGQNCRSVALAEYALELQAQRYLSLYQELL
ncbi:glycosyl transferase [Leptolyngbya sp. 'hensonii']|uniref:glycosyltransferase family 4 protein n=1 Tax=Leptolyngbya sp. 'hensonii' TaxID=1922337 RepID=UPI00094FC331|nr:glycosyltransferase family 4 protein [Leptolyngbya sp. 'hensonii']OLP18615.1 glycosyl transferase [Leptolyngbya sp. 'hensonii']